MRTEVEAPVTEPLIVKVAVSGVRKAFGDVLALDGVDLSMTAGEVVAVVGPSGCGKSTLLSIVCGLEAPDAGTVDAPPAALMPQRDGLLPWLSALDNAALSRRVAGAYLDLCEAAGLDAGALPPRHLCLSAPIAQPLQKAGAVDVLVAARPDEAALLDLVESR